MIRIASPSQRPPCYQIAMHRRLLVPLAAALLALPACRTTEVLVGCDDFGADADAQKVEAFLDTADRFDRDAARLAGDVEAGCRALAADLGVTVPPPAADELPVEAACNAVRDEIDAIVNEALPVGSSLTVEFVPPVCTVDVDAYGQCVAECDANVDVNADLMCEEGRLSGRCTGTCSGTCRVEGMVDCDATCSGTCSGSCSGTCAGACDGACSATDEMGRCIGTCEGTCTGSCNGTCTGSCEGECIAEIEGSCEGTCTGGCDVEYQEPRCEGDVDVEADVECEAACEARVDAQAECTEPSVTVYFDGMVDPDAADRFAALLDALEAQLPRLLALREQLTAVAESGGRLVTTFDSAASAAGRISARATACFADAALVAADAATTVDITLSVTVEVTASASASAG